MTWKRIAGAALVALLLGSLCAGALADAVDLNAVWANGQSPAQPEPTAAKRDLTRELGYMVVHPTEGLTYDTPLDTLSVILPRLDAEGGTGAFVLSRADGEVVGRYTAADLLRDTWSAEGDAGDTAANCWTYHNPDWETGTHLRVRLPEPLTDAGEYTMTIEKDAIVSKAYGVGNEPITVHFAIGEYGITGLQATIDGQVTPNITDILPVFHAGDQLRIDFRIGGEAASAGFYFFGDTETVDMIDVAIDPALGGYDEASEMWRINASGSVVLTFTDFNPEEMTILFFPPEPVEEADALMGLAYELVVEAKE